MALLPSAAVHAQDKPMDLRPELVTPLRAAQELLQERKFAQTLERLADTDSVAGKTPVERYAIERLRAAAASGAGDLDASAKALEAVLATGQTPAAEELPLIEALAGAQFNLKRYGPAAQSAQRYFAQGGRSLPMRTLLAQALYFSADFRSAVQQLQALQRAQQAAGVTVPQAQLQMLASSYLKLEDEAGYMGVLEQLLATDPKPQTWTDLLVRVERRPDFAPRLVIDLFRLQRAAGAMSEGSDWLELADLALKAGFPAEARSAVDAGFSAGMLGTGADADKHARYRDQVRQRAADELKALEPRAAAAPDANVNADELFKRGWRLVLHGRRDAGLAMMQQALDLGNLEHTADARLRFAVAQHQAGNVTRARELFRLLQADGGADGVALLARLWGVLLSTAPVKAP